MLECVFDRTMGMDVGRDRGPYGSEVEFRLPYLVSILMGPGGARIIVLLVLSVPGGAVVPHLSRNSERIYRDRNTR